MIYNERKEYPNNLRDTKNSTAFWICDKIATFHLYNILKLFDIKKETLDQYDVQVQDMNWRQFIKYCESIDIDIVTGHDTKPFMNLPLHEFFKEYIIPYDIKIRRSEVPEHELVTEESVSA